MDVHPLSQSFSAFHEMPAEGISSRKPYLANGYYQLAKLLHYKLKAIELVSFFTHLLLLSAVCSRALESRSAAFGEVWRGSCHTLLPDDSPTLPANNFKWVRLLCHHLMSEIANVCSLICLSFEYFYPRRSALTTLKLLPSYLTNIIPPQDRKTSFLYSRHFPSRSCCCRRALIMHRPHPISHFAPFFFFGGHLSFFSQSSIVSSTRVFSANVAARATLLIGHLFSCFTNAHVILCSVA